jgi:hypothetical protein
MGAATTKSRAIGSRDQPDDGLSSSSFVMAQPPLGKGLRRFQNDIITIYSLPRRRYWEKQANSEKSAAEDGEGKGCCELCGQRNDDFAYEFTFL